MRFANRPEGCDPRAQGAHLRCHARPAQEIRSEPPGADRSVPEVLAGEPPGERIERLAGDLVEPRL